MIKRKLFYTLLIVALLVAFAGTVFAEGKVVKLVIPELCASNFTQATAIFDGFGSVASYEVDVESTSAVLSFSDNGADLEGIMEALKGIAMPVESTEDVK